MDLYTAGMVPGLEGGNWADLPNSVQGFIFTDVADFQKAVTAGYGTDVATLTGGAALRLQSLEATLLATIQQEEHFRLFRKLEKTNATATVDEFSIKQQIGGFPGSAFNSELGDIQDDSSTYLRRVGLVKYLMTQRKISVVQRSQKTLVDTTADQNLDATLELMTSAEWGFFYGDSDASSVEFDGIYKTVAASAPADHVKDLRGKTISPMAVEVIDSAQLVAGYGSFGRLTDGFWSQMIQADLDQKLDPAFRVGPNQVPVKIGTPVEGVRTTWGSIASNPDVFIQEGQMPFTSRSAFFASIVAAAGVTAPASVVGTPGADATSQFGAEHAGLFYYAVESGNKNGRSTLVKSAQVTVAAGDVVSLVITAAGAPNETYYQIYRSRKNGTNADNDFREMVRVKKDGATTTYLDANQWIPGTSMVFLLSMGAGRNAITMRRLLPMTRFALYPTTQAVYPWAQLLFLYLRVGKPNQHRVLINVLPSGQLWRPFNV